MSPKNNNPLGGLSIDFSDELSKNLTIHTNVKQEIIITTADKMKLVLTSSKEILTSKRDWWTPAGLFVSFIATLCSADFKDSLGLTKEFWHAIFVILALATIVWLVVTLIKLYKNWGMGDLDKIIKCIQLKEEKT